MKGVFMNCLNCFYSRSNKDRGYGCEETHENTEWGVCENKDAEAFLHLQISVEAFPDCKCFRNYNTVNDTV